MKREYDLGSPFSQMKPVNICKKISNYRISELNAQPISNKEILDENSFFKIEKQRNNPSPQVTV